MKPTKHLYRLIKEGGTPKPMKTALITLRDYRQWMRLVGQPYPKGVTPRTLGNRPAKYKYKAIFYSFT